MKHPFCIATFALLVGCTDPVDKAAKKRIFSPEDPPQAVSAANERLAPEDVADHPAVARRVLGMGAAEATERLGPHKFSSTVSFEWSTLGKNVKLTETRLLRAGSGGVSGDFHAIIENSRDQGLEVLRVHSDVFAKSRYGKLRQRKRDRGMAERTREETFGAIRDFDALFRGRLKLAPPTSVTYEKRTAWKYAVSLGPELKDPPSRLPPALTSKAGPDDTTARRMAFYQQHQPRALQGEVLVDAETSVVLKTHLDGRAGMSVDAGDAELRLVLDTAITEVGREPELKTPADFLPDQDKPQGIAAALERFGIERATADAGATFDGAPDDETE